MSSWDAPKLLIVEDDRELCRVMSREACALGYDVECRHTLAHAEVTIRSIKNSFFYGIVLLDLKLTDGDSSELVPELRQANPPPLIVVVSAYLTASRIIELSELGVALCIPKPFGIHELMRRIEALRSSPKSTTPPPPLSERRLSHREEQVLKCGRTGLSRKETAARLGISTHSVRTYWERILDKMGLDSERRAVTAGAEARSVAVSSLELASAAEDASAESSFPPEASSQSGLRRSVDVRKIVPNFEEARRKINTR